MNEELEKNISRERSVLVPFLVGGIVGAGIALLLAPKSGKELRRDISDAASKTRDTVAETVDKGKALYEDSASAIKGAIDAGKMAYIQERDRHRQAV